MTNKIRKQVLVIGGIVLLFYSLSTILLNINSGACGEGICYLALVTLFGGGMGTYFLLEGLSND